MSSIAPGSLSFGEFIRRYEGAIKQSLNPRQKAAIRHTTGPLQILAGPGSGKSEILVARALKLVLVDGAAAGSIFLTTFTQKAARNLEDRTADRLSGMGYSETLEDLRTGTLHSLCDRIMRDLRWSSYADYRLLDETEQHFFVYAHTAWLDDAPREFWEYFRFLTPRASVRYGPNKWQKTGALVTLLNRVADEEVDLWRLERSRDSALVQLAQVCAAYRRELADRNRTDFSSIQLHFKEFLDTAIGRRFIRGDSVRSLPPLRFILVDEYQDTNPLQETIYLRLAQATGGNIAIVGDDDQALYRFRGGTVECMVRFSERCQSVLGAPPTRIQLQTNYRSLPEIVRWAEGVLLRQPAMQRAGARTAKNAMAIKRRRVPGYNPVQRIEARNHESLGERVAEVIQEILDGGLVDDASQIAVLLKSSRESPRNAGPVARALRDRGINVYNPRSKAFLEAEEVAGMLGALIQILDRGGLVGDTMRGWMRDSITDWRSEYERLARTHRDLPSYVNSVARALRRRKPGEWLQVTVRDFFYRILACSPFTRWQDEPMRTYRLGRLSAILESFSSTEGSDALRVSSQEPGRFSEGWLRSRFYPRLVGYLHQASLDDPADLDFEIVPGAVQVMTVHQSKGLEFPIVFVDSITMAPNPNDSTYRLEDALIRYSVNPRKLASAEIRAVQDLARFFYVAYTRAKNLLVLFGTNREFSRAVVSVGEVVDG